MNALRPWWSRLQKTWNHAWPAGQLIAPPSRAAWPESSQGEGLTGTQAHDSTMGSKRQRNSYTTSANVLIFLPVVVSTAVHRQKLSLAKVIQGGMGPVQLSKCPGKTLPLH